MKTITINDQVIEFDDETECLVQVGKGPKGKYKPRYNLKGNPGQAVMYYNGINIGNGFKKRLVIDGKIIARQFS